MLPSPDQEISGFTNQLGILFTMPGWTVTHMEYAKGNMIAKVESGGSTVQNLMDWASQNHANVDVRSEGIFVTMSMTLKGRVAPNNIYSVNRSAF